MHGLRFVLSTWLFVGTALAAGPSPEELAVARDLFEEAQKAQEAEDWASCERQIAEAVAIVETPGLRFHLAFCKEQQGRWVAALVDYKRAQELVQGGVEAKDVVELLGPAIERMETDTPRLTLTLAEIPPGTTLYLDGKERSPRLIGKTVPVDPGGIRLSVSAPGYEAFERHVNLLKKERRTVGIILIPKPETAAPPPQPAKPEAARRSAARDSSGIGAKGVVLIGEGALTLGALTLGVLSSLDKADLTRRRNALVGQIGTAGCSTAESDPRCETLETTNADLERSDLLELTGYVAAGVGLTAFVATWLVWDTQSDATEARFELLPLVGGAAAMYSAGF